MIRSRGALSIQGAFAAVCVAVVGLGCHGVKISSVSVSGNPKTGDVSGSVSFSEATPAAVAMEFGDEPISETVYFNFDSYTIYGDEYKRLLKKIFEAAHAGCDSVKIVSGCCPIGTDEYNLLLGSKRANSIAKIIESVMIKPVGIEITNYGETHLVTTDKNSYWKNRRAVITFTK